MKVDPKSCKKVLIYYIGNLAPNSVKYLYIISNELNRSIEDKYME